MNTPDRSPEPPAKPGDEVDPGAPQTAEGICPRCGGTGISNGVRCPACAGTGVVTVNVGDA